MIALEPSVEELERMLAAVGQRIISHLATLAEQEGNALDAELVELVHRAEYGQAALGVARLSFADLCERPTGPADYLAIAQSFHTLVIDDVPVLRAEQRDAVRRFITLIDVLYDQGVKLVISAQAEPADLYKGADGAEAFEFSRTVSRLVEMRSMDYLRRPHGPSRPNLIVET